MRSDSESLSNVSQRRPRMSLTLEDGRRYAYGNGVAPSEVDTESSKRTPLVIGAVLVVGAAIAFVGLRGGSDRAPAPLTKAIEPTAPEAAKASRTVAEVSNAIPAASASEAAPAASATAVPSEAPGTPSAQASGPTAPAPAAPAQAVAAPADVARPAKVSSAAPAVKAPGAATLRPAVAGNARPSRSDNPYSESSSAANSDNPY